MKRGVRGRWLQWQRYRYQGLCAEGLEPPLAYRIATVEAKTRRNLARIIGGQHARSAELKWAVTDDSVHCYMTGTIEGLSDNQVAAIEAMNRSTHN